MKEQRTKQILIHIAASLGCFWLGNRVGLLYVSAVGTITQRLAAAVNLSKIVLHPLQLSSAPIPVGCGVGAILLAGLAYLCIKYSGHRLVPQKEYGSARWGTAADIAPFLHEKASENIPLTATESLSLAMKMPVTAENNYNRNKNVIVFGPSGSGKSYSVAGPQLLQFNSNYVLSDPKGELLDTYGNVLVSQGYDVKVFNLKDRDKSDHYNPFAYIHDTDDIVVVAKNLIKNMKEDPRQKNTADPIWEEGSTSLLEALLAYAIDITNEAAVEALFDDAVATFGRLDVYFTIAGISPVGTAVTTSYEDYKKVVALDMDSVFLGSKYCIPHMIKTGGGVILNLVGTYGIRPTPNKLSYSAAKAGALSITRSVAIDFARDNIRCNAICPGFVNTPLNNGFEGEARQRFLNTYQPAPFEIQAKDIAETALFLASDEARAITGQAIVVDGGTEASLYLNYKRPSADK